MIAFEDDTFYLDDGERVPYVCPKCKRPIAFADVAAVTCDRCGHFAPAADFMHHQVRLTTHKIQ